MTFEKLAEKMIEVKQIAGTDTAASLTAKKILRMDVTTHNIQEIDKLLSSFTRNR